ncbi:hypothetical protein CSOJ01_16057 [Colletotrichum sojae]|uniref:Uncharacterized protein n=1 Tax=Colletotrichum sojae TaxID=2175907 RepID=A0A8H6MF77_9PEZI|nr:hypothetical protein CSOJ01_16057 [Colletotrichum sojae]
MLLTDTPKLVWLMRISPSTPYGLAGFVDSCGCRTALYSVPICSPIHC